MKHFFSVYVFSFLVGFALWSVHMKGVKNIVVAAQAVTQFLSRRADQNKVARRRKKHA
jgi:hypothetical protein